MPRRKAVEPPLKASRNTSQRIRDACADALEQSLPMIVNVANGRVDKTTVANQIAAFDKLGKYGVGTRITVEIAGEELIGVFARVLQETCNLPIESLDLFIDRLKEELQKLEQEEVEEPLENEAYD